MNSYSTHEAKAKFSEILRKVRNGQRVEITYHGKTVAEIRPASEVEATLEARLAKLKADGVISGSAEEVTFKPLRPRKGALQRFLEERD